MKSMPGGSFRLSWWLWCNGHGPHPEGLNAESGREADPGCAPKLHAENVAIHAVCAVLVYSVALRFLMLGSRTKSLEHHARQERIAGIAAVLFATHPANSEAVCSVVGRSDLLGCFGVLSAFLCQTNALWSATYSGKAMYATLAFVFFWAAILAKETAVMIAPVIVAHGILTAFGPAGANSAAVRRSEAIQRYLLPSMYLATGTVGTYLGYRFWLMGGKGFGVGHDVFRKAENPMAFVDDFVGRALSKAHIHARYFLILLYPRELSCDWSFNCIPTIDSVYDRRNTWAGALYAAIAALIIRAFPWQATRAGLYGKSIRKVSGESSVVRSNWFELPALMATGWMCLFFVPASGVLFDVGTCIGERLLYVPSIGFAVLLAVALDSLASSRASAVPAVASAGQQSAPKSKEGARPGKTIPASPNFGCFTIAAAIVMVYTARSRLRALDWLDEQKLFESAFQVCPDSVKVRLNSGTLRRRYADWDGALEHYRTAKAIHPSFCEVDYWIGLTLLNKREEEKAIKVLEDAVRCKFNKDNSIRILKMYFEPQLKTRPDDVALKLRWAKVVFHAGMHIDGYVGPVGVVWITPDRLCYPAVWYAVLIN